MLANMHVKKDKLVQVQHLLKYYPSIRLQGNPQRYEGMRGYDGKATIYFEGEVKEVEGFETDVITNGFSYRE
jgi:hypothetical protein